MREITVATVQMKPELGKAEDNLVKMSDFISTITSQQKVDLIVFPELITCGYELGVQFTELAQRVPGPAINLMAQRAADTGVYIAFGLATKEKVESILYNSAALVGPEGELIGTYNKIHLRGEERMAFREGFKMPVFDTGEIGKIGLLLGWDLAFPEVARAMALDGAELLCVMSNWEGNYIDEWKTYIRARAFENALYIAAANRVGTDVTMKFGGESMIVGPRGKLYAALETDAEFRKELAREQQDLLKEIQSLRELREKELRESKAAQEAKEAIKEVAAEMARKAEGVAVAAAGAGGSDGDKKADVVDGVKVLEAEKPADKPKETPKEPQREPAREPARESKKAAPEPIRKPEPTEGYCVARIDLDEVRRYREEFQTLQNRQPTVYKAIVRRY